MGRFLRTRSGVHRGLHGPRPWLLGALGVLASILAGPAGLEAHDLWIEPSTFRPRPGATVDLALRVGEGFAGAPVPRHSTLIERFALVGRAGESRVEGRWGADPAGRVRTAETGPAVVIYRSRRMATVLSGAEFERHLAAEGLQEVEPYGHRPW